MTSVDDGIRGKDFLIVSDAKITVDVQGDGLKSDNDEDAEKGYISIVSGTFHLTSGGDAVQAETSVLITGGEFTITSGGGSGATIDEDTSAKGLKAGVNVAVPEGIAVQKKLLASAKASVSTYRIMPSCYADSWMNYNVNTLELPLKGQVKRSSVAESLRPSVFLFPLP